VQDKKISFYIFVYQMSIIAFSNITKTYGSVCVFDGLSISFHPKQKVGLIGQNGSGKTTLFRMILGQEVPDTGSVSVQKDLKIGYLPQEPDFPDEKTVFEVMHEGLGELSEKHRRLESLSAKLGTLSGSSLHQTMREYDRLAHEIEMEGGWAVEARIRSILTGLGIHEDLHHVCVRTLSGGQLSRLGLARVLLRPTDVLLFDEPTNHLDLQAICWLESYLKNYSGAVLLVSHDRFLLDQLTERIVEIEGRRACSYKGNYTQHLHLKQQEQLHRQRQYQQRKEFVEHTLDFIARNKDQEGMRKTARGRKTRLRRLLSSRPDFLDRGPSKQSFSFRFEGDVQRSEKILSVEQISKCYGDLILFQNLSFTLRRGGRLAVTGPNGSGKSTLLKILMGHLCADGGSVGKGEHLVYGYLDQQAQTLDPNKTVLEEAAAVRPDFKPEELRNKLAAFMFRGDQVFQKTGTLSGGQRNRLMLCKIVLSNPDVLLLDEPTNHLDIESCEAFEEALEGYEGSVIAVSHDRYFIDHLFDELLILGINREGQRCIGHSEWVNKGSDEKGVFSLWNDIVALHMEQTKADSSFSKLNSRTVSTKKPSLQAPPEIRRYNALSIEEIENKILLTEEEISVLTEQYGQENLYRNSTLLFELKDKLDTKKNELDVLYLAYDWKLKKK
jgi:ATP-binding cassette subfamily F protein 3